MKEFLAIATSFLVIVGLAIFMFISNDKHSISVKQNTEMNTLIENQKTEIESLKVEVEALRSHVYEMDSIYHKRNID